MPLTTNPVTLRLMVEEDIPMLHEWLNRPHIVEWWGGQAERPSFEDTRAKYVARMAAEHVTTYIAMLGTKPIGYAQSYIPFGQGGGWWPEETDPGVRGIDQYLADPELLGKGLGTQLVLALVDLLFMDNSVTRIQTDPAPHNARAIRCYEKAGFRRVTTIETPDGLALYMLRERQAPIKAI
jgi:AacA4 family aminoglycoside N(6')-acetyltransferase